MSGRSRQCRNKIQNLGINKNAKRRRSILPNYSHGRLDYPTKTTAIDFLSHFRHFTTKNFSDRTTNFKYECSRKFLSTIPNRWEWDSIWPAGVVNRPTTSSSAAATAFDSRNSKPLTRTTNKIRIPRRSQQFVRPRGRFIRRVLWSCLRRFFPEFVSTTKIPGKRS